MQIHSQILAQIQRVSKGDSFRITEMTVTEKPNEIWRLPEQDVPLVNALIQATTSNGPVILQVNDIVDPPGGKKLFLAQEIALKE